MLSEPNKNRIRLWIAGTWLLLTLPGVLFYYRFGKALRPVWHPLLQWHLRWLLFRARHWPSPRLALSITTEEFVLLYEGKAP